MSQIKIILKIIKSIVPLPFKKSFHKWITFLKASKFGFFKWIFLHGDEKYIYFQRKLYDYWAARSEYTINGIDDHVVGTYDLQNEWKDYDKYLFKHIDISYKNKLALDFATGPGRNIIKYHNKFKRIDGIDISRFNIENARKNLINHNISIPRLIVNNGMDLKEVSSNTYDFILSTIAMQHICVYKIRLNLFSEFFRVLKRGGHIAIQMSYGTEGVNSVPYYTNDYAAIETNGLKDTQIESPNQIGQDLKDIGFSKFEYWIRTAPAKGSTNKWIYFTATKPIY